MKCVQYLQDYRMNWSLRWMKAATKLHRTRADVIRQAVEYYLDDFEDISRAVEVLRDSADPNLDWETVKHHLLRKH